MAAAGYLRNTALAAAADDRLLKATLDINIIVVVLRRSRAFILQLAAPRQKEMQHFKGCRSWRRADTGENLSDFSLIMTHLAEITSLPLDSRAEEDSLSI